MRIVFFGTPELALPTLAAVAGRHTVTAVVCQPDKPQGRGKKLEPCPAKVWAEGHGIAVHQPVKLNDGAFEAWLKDQAPDVCVLVAYGRILKQPILDVPRRGFLNLHPSLLPKYRGPSPIQSCVLHGDAVSGVTIMEITMDVDAGGILLQEKEPVHPNDTTASLTERLSAKGAALMVRGLDLLASGEARFTPQDSARATYTAMFTKEDGRIRWGQSAAAIHNLVRASIPWPVAHCAFHGEAFRILSTAVVSGAASEAPGTVVNVAKDHLLVAAGQDLIAVREVQAPGKRAMAVGDFLRGHSVVPGDRFEDL